MGELIHQFGIDWKLLLAQAVNFFILLAVLRKFAYKPILGMLEKRRKDIEKGVTYTKEAEAKLREIGVLKEETLKKAQHDALAIVTGAEETGKKRKNEIIEEANRKVEGVVVDARRLIEEEKAKMGDEVYKSAQNLIRSGIEKVIKELPAGERDKKLIEEALRELKSAKKAV